MVISTGITLPRCDSVWALYALQNSMMLTPCWPSAGPIGGAGVAWPALICSLMTAETFFLGGMSGPNDVVCGGSSRPLGGARGACQILATWLNESSTGVSRPKIDTSTLSFWASGLISEMVAGRVSNGPSMTVTVSPTSKSTTLTSGLLDFASAGARLGASIEKTSSRLSGTGWWV